jgi:hypothetical protein
MKSRAMLAGLCAAALLTTAGAAQMQAAAIFTGSEVGSWQNLQGAAGAIYTIPNNDSAPGANSVASFALLGCGLMGLGLASRRKAG